MITAVQAMVNIVTFLVEKSFALQSSRNLNLACVVAVFFGKSK